MHKLLFLIFYIFFINTFINAQISIKSDIFLIHKIDSFKESDYLNFINEIEKNSFFKTYESLYNFEHYKYEKKEELLLRREEILFFGSLTFVTFGSWLFFSLFNSFIYNEPFGKIRREQFLPMILGSGTISIAVVFTDIFLHIKPKLDKKNIEVY